MNEKERSKMIDQIGNYILSRQFAKHEVDVPEALTVLASVTDQIIRSLCEVMEMDAEEMLTHFCNALQQPLEKERHYSTGDKDADELMGKIIAEMKDGGDIEEIVNKYISCDDPELRQELIEKMTELRDNHRIDNVKVGYEKQDDKNPVLTMSMANEIESTANEMLKNLMEEGSDNLPRPVILTIAIIAIAKFTGKPVSLDTKK